MSRGAYREESPSSQTTPSLPGLATCSQEALSMSLAAGVVPLAPGPHSLQWRLTPFLGAHHSSWRRSRSARKTSGRKRASSCFSGSCCWESSGPGQRPLGEMWRRRPRWPPLLGSQTSPSPPPCLMWVPPFPPGRPGFRFVSGCGGSSFWTKGGKRPAPGIFGLLLGLGLSLPLAWSSAFTCPWWDQWGNRRGAWQHQNNAPLEMMGEA